MAAAIVPMPGDSSKYYIFTTDAGYYTDPPHEGLNYSIVDMKGDFGRGAITAKNIHLVDTAAEKVVVIRQCGKQAYWVVTRAIQSNTFYAFHVTRSGVSTVPVLSSVGLVPVPNLLSALGYMKASVDGRRLAVGFYTHDTMEVYDFDPATGSVSNALQIWGRTYGVAFSPDNTKLYALSYESPTNRAPKLFQYDISSHDRARIEASRSAITSFHVNAAMQIGPDGKNYCARNGDSTLSVIEHPNDSGPACSFKFRAIDLQGRLCQFGLPNLIDNELYLDDMIAGPDATICAGDTAAITAYGGVGYEW
jgi:DNA-binding beta-propeller fold protein YncE